MKTATQFPDDSNPRPPSPEPYFHRSPTSQNAAKAVRPSVRSQVARVFDFIDSHGDYGATDREIQHGLELDGNSQRPRRVWLQKHGFVTTKGIPAEVRDRSTVWVTTSKPLRLRNAR